MVALSAIFMRFLFFPGNNGTPLYKLAHQGKLSLRAHAGQVKPSEGKPLYPNPS